MTDDATLREQYHYHPTITHYRCYNIIITTHRNDFLAKPYANATDDYDDDTDKDEKDDEGSDPKTNEYDAGDASEYDTDDNNECDTD